MEEGSANSSTAVAGGGRHRGHRRGSGTVPRSGLGGPCDAGQAGVVATQAIRFASAEAAVPGGPDLNQANAAIDTAGLILTAAFRMHRDEDGVVRLQVLNSGNATRSSYITLTRPEGSSADLGSTDPDVGLAQMESLPLGNGQMMDVYLLTVSPEGYGDLDLQVLVGMADGLGSFNIALSLEEVP